MTSSIERPPSDRATGRDAASGLLALVIDVAAGTLVAANAAGRQAWGLPAGGDGPPMSPDTPLPLDPPPSLDRATPALARLPQAALSGDGETLAFWTPRGLLRVPCRVEAVPGAPGRFLVRGLADDHGDNAPARGLGISGRRRHAPAQPSQDQRLARLAHEVRTPLGAAIAYAEFIKDEHLGPVGNDRYREYARHIYDSARLALSVMDGMLAPMLASSMPPPELDDQPHDGLPDLAFRDLDLAVVIDACLAVARPLAERAGLDLAACHTPGTPRVIADEVSLKQMLLNLITNAIKFARPGDRITLAAACGGDGGLRLEVADTGPGMAAAAPAAMSVEGFPGGGIGLPLTRALAEANGATLIVDSAPGHGTRVTIAFGKDRVVP